MFKKIKIAAGFILYFLIMTSFVSAQKQMSGWLKGNVQLTGGESFEALLRYNSQFREGLLQVKDGDKVKTLSPKKVLFFEFYEPYADKKRIFVSTPVFIEKYNYTKNLFLEVLYSGAEISLVRRYDIIGFRKHETIYLLDNNTSRIHLYAHGSEFYGNDKKYLKVNRKLLLSQMGSQKEKVDLFIKENKLSFSKLAHIIKILGHYNSLMSLTSEL